MLISSHILDELSRLATHYGFIDSGRMVKEMSAGELEARCRKCMRLDVSDTRALARVLDRQKAEYHIVDDTHADLYTELPVTELVLALDKLRSAYDYIFIDCPPSLELLTLNALCAADQILVPVQCEYYALEGLSDLMATLRAVKKNLNPKLEIFGLLLTMYDGRTNFSLQVAEEVRRHFPGKVFRAVIPRNVRLAEAPSHGVPVFSYDKYSRGAEAYAALADEILARRKPV